MKNDIRVVSFDLDGVLFDGQSAAYPVASQIGLGEKFRVALKKVSDEDMSLSDSIREGCVIWEGVPVDGTLDPLVEQLPLMTGAEDVISKLKEWGYTVGCISSGVSQFFLKPFKKRLDLDFAFSNILGEEDGKHDGKVHYVMGGPQKAETARKYLSENGFSIENLASVGDGENDIDLFRISSMSIAFNPTSDRVSKAASVTIRSKDLRNILLHFIPDVI